MPVLPTADAKRNINAEINAPVMTGATENLKASENLGNTVIDLTQKWSAANDVMQYTEAKSVHALGIAENEGKALADPDYRNSEAYKKENERIKKNSLAYIANAQVRNKAALEFDFDGKVSDLKIDAQFRQKEIAYTKVRAENYLDTLQQKKLQAGTELERNAMDFKIKELLVANVGSGVLSPEEAQKMLKASEITGVKYEIYDDNSTKESDSVVLKELKDMKNPKYSYLDPKSRLSLIEESQKRIFQNNQTFKREIETSKDDRTQAIYKKINDRTLSMADIDAERKIPEEQGGLGEKALNSIQDGVIRGIDADQKLIEQSDAYSENYYELITSLVDDPMDSVKAREKINDAYRDGYISPKEAIFLNTLKTELSNINDIRGIEASSKKLNVMGVEFNVRTDLGIRSALKNLNIALGGRNATAKESAKAIKRLVNGLADGEDPIKLQKNILYEDAITRNPEIQLFPETGQLCMDDSCQIRMVFPNGDVKDHQGTKKEKK